MAKGGTARASFLFFAQCYNEDMGSGEFERLYKNLNPRQRDAVNAIEGPVMVIAGPGTGKTQILTLRIANILRKTDVGPEGILALTFTEAAARAMKERLVKIIGSDGFRVEIATFHAFANSIIRAHPDAFPRIVGGSPIGDVDRIQLMKEAIETAPLKLLRPFGDTFFYLEPALRAISELKRENVRTEDFRELIVAQEREFKNIPDKKYERGARKGVMKGKYALLKKEIEKNKELATLYEAYQGMLTKRKRYDYDDMILETVAALEEREDLRLYLQEKYQYILADEHQDTNQAQQKILELLGSFFAEPNLFIVGDEKQAIYRFQGATLKNFLSFQELYPNSRVVSLTDNYRSTQTILDAAHGLMTHGNEGITRKRLKAQAGHLEAPVRCCAFSTEEHEHRFIARDIKEKIASGASPEEIAVLVRNNSDAVPLADMLARAGVRAVIEQEQNVLLDRDIRKFLLMLRAIDNFGDDEAFLKMLHVDFLGLESFDLILLVSGARRARTPVYAVARSLALLSKVGVSDPKAFLRVYKLLASWHATGKNEGLLELLEMVIRDSGFLAYILKSRYATEKMEKMRRFLADAARLVAAHRDYTLHDFLIFIDTLEEHNIGIRKATPATERGAVRLMTAHKSKGLEFDYVYIVGALDTHWGNRRERTYFKLPIRPTAGDKGNDEDERRLFYVALTRARKGVTVTFATERDAGVRLPSRFIEEIPERHRELVSGSAVEEEFLKTREDVFAPRTSPAASVSDKEYLNKLFIEHGFSVTALNNYLLCPWRYFYLNLLRIPKPQTKHQMYGIAMHEALRFFFDLLKKGKVSGGKRDVTRLVKRFEEELGRLPLSERDLAACRARGAEALAGYYHAYRNQFHRATLNELAIKGVFLPDCPGLPGDVLRLTGKIDKLELFGKGKVNVVDYKTRKPLSRNQIEGKTRHGKIEYKRQLVFYKLILELFENEPARLPGQGPGKYDMETGEIDFLEPDDKGRYKKERFEISAEEVDELKETIRHAAREIFDLAFWDRRCSDRKCEYCALREAATPTLT
jgi:DNA helicase-2/ATP-dependent DNA helicase PcrA